jgi:hypothetical protein
LADDVFRRGGFGVDYLPAFVAAAPAATVSA